MFATYPKLVRFIFWTSLSLALIALIAFNVVVVWVATGPRSLSNYVPEFEQAISNAQDQFDVKIGDIMLIWDGWQHPIDVRLKDIKLYTKQEILFAKFPSISVGLNIPALSQGKLQPNAIEIFEPKINLYMREDGEITPGSSWPSSPSEARRSNRSSPCRCGAVVDPRWRRGARRRGGWR